MKILMLTPDCQMIDRRILQEAKTLIAAGHTVTLLAGFECTQPTTYVEDGIWIHRFQYDWDDERLKKLRAKLPNNDQLKMFVNRAFMYVARNYFRVGPFDRFIHEQGLKHPSDVVHVHDLPVLQAGVLLAKTWNVPLIYDAHELYYAQDVLPKETQKKLFRTESRLIGHPSVVITVNEFIARVMAERYQIQTPTVLYNATNLPDDFDSVKKGAESLLRQRTQAKGPILLYQGWISPERNIETLVRAMGHVPEPVCLAMVGYGAYEAKLKDVAKQLGVDHRIHFLGQVASKEMLHYTVGADLGLIPYLPIDENHLYCSPNKFFEFVLAGVPILANTSPFFLSMRDRYGVVECVDMSSPAEVGACIRKLLAGDGLSNLKKKLPAAANVLNWTVEGRKLVSLYDALRQSNTCRAA